MAACINYWSPHLNSTMFHRCLFMIIFCFFLMTPPYVTSLNFSIPKITTEQSNVQIRTERDAYVSSDGIQVTRIGQDQQQSSGRASYVEHLHLWDNASRNVADFTTHFTFVIDSQGRSNYGDGLAFFLLPSNISNIDITAGGALGLPINPTTIVNTSSFVAVEFDTFLNKEGWDPNVSTVTHVGININSLTSVNYSIWSANIANGSEHEAWISHNSGSKILDVRFTGYVNNTRFIHNKLSYIVDLREYLPEWVTIGFSASTGAFFEKHTVKSWDFSSNL